MQRGVHKGLTPERILAESFAMVDAGGPAALTMRALAKRLDVAAMAIYNHYRDRDAILDALAEQMFAQLPRAAAGGRKGWKTRLRSILQAAQEFASRHPHVYRLAMTRPNKPSSAFQLTEEAISVLREAGLSEKQSLTVYHTFVILLHGFPFWREGYEQHADCTPLDSALTAEQQFAASVEWLLQAVAVVAKS
jgi:AcrR family transcriptional regulator